MLEAKDDINGWRKLRQISGNFSRFKGLKEENVTSISILLIFLFSCCLMVERM